MEAVKQNGSALAYGSEELQADSDIVREAVKQSGFAFKYASKELQADSNFVLEAVKQNCGAVLYASKELQADSNFMREAVKLNSHVLKYTSKETPTEVAFTDVKGDTSTLKLVDKRMEWWVGGRCDLDDINKLRWLMHGAIRAPQHTALNARLVNPAPRTSAADKLKVDIIRMARACPNVELDGFGEEEL